MSDLATNFHLNHSYGQTIKTKNQASRNQKLNNWISKVMQTELKLKPRHIISSLLSSGPHGRGARETNQKISKRLKIKIWKKKKKKSRFSNIWSESVEDHSPVRDGRGPNDLTPRFSIDHQDVPHVLTDETKKLNTKTFIPALKHLWAQTTQRGLTDDPKEATRTNPWPMSRQLIDQYHPESEWSSAAKSFCTHRVQ